MAEQPFTARTDPMASPLDATPKRKGVNDESQRNLKMARAFFEKAKNYQKKFSQSWTTYRNMYNGDTNTTTAQTGRTPAYRQNMSINIIRATIQSTLPILTDTSPGFNVEAQEPTDFEFSQLLSKVTEHVWEKISANVTLLEALMDMMIVDIGILKCYWDSDAENGAGEIAFYVPDPNNIFVLQHTRDFDKNCPGVIERSWKRVGELRRTFPKMAKLIKADSSDKSATDKADEMTASLTTAILVTPVDQDPGLGNIPPLGSFGDEEDMAEVWEFWTTDETLEEFETIIDKGTKDERKEKQIKKKYPQGKLVTLLPNQNLELQAVANPYKHGKFPFVRFVDQVLPRSFYGEGEAKPLENLQRLITKTNNNIGDYMNFTGNPVWLIPEDSGVNPNNITNAMGLIIPYEGESEPKRLIPPALPAYYFQYLDTLQRWGETISGIQDVSQGRKPKGVTAAQAIETLQEAAQTRIRLKERNMNSTLGQLGKLMIGLIMQFYKEPRVVRITGEGSKWPEFF